MKGWWLSSGSTYVADETCVKGQSVRAENRHKVMVTGDRMHHGQVFFCRHCDNYRC